ncbi:hypothetical protein EXN66_Car000188 [Channa argus]|uniref:Uncharacterized protein n=1 Tax=Channa argus TaxID=215402 RepID=A0A6G1QY66_CHAAH|nr:hypothetical protein EXN66_Car000188 [Channa argus]
MPEIEEFNQNLETCFFHELYVFNAVMMKERGGRPDTDREKGNDLDKKINDGIIVTNKSVVHEQRIIYPYLMMIGLGKVKGV